MFRHTTWLLAFLCALSLVPAAEAQTPDARAEARARFERGVALFDEGRLDAALAEFQEAYRIAPSYAVFFNLGQVHARLGNAVEAVEAFERYLAEGGDRVPAPRRALVERELATQRARIATLVIEVDAPGASISVDGSVVAQTPLTEPIRVTVGEHVIGVRAGGYEPQQRRISVAGGVTETVRFTLSETGAARATIRITSALRDVEIAVDGQVMGRTPLDSSLSVTPGAREIRATRPGYHPFSRVIDVGMGAEAELELELEPDLSATEALGTLLVRTPPGASLSIDGVSMDGVDTILLPVGDHTLRVEMPDVQPFVQRVSLPAGETTEIQPELRYTPAARAARQAGAESQRMAAFAFAITGGVLLAGGAGISIWNEARRGELALDDRRALLERCYATPGMPPDECFGPVIPVGTPQGMQTDALDAAQAEFNGDVDLFNGMMALGYTLVGLGAASLLTSVVLFVTTPSDEDVATVRLSVGPGSVSLSGRF